MKVAANTQLMRMLNRSAVLDLVRESGAISRTEISRELDLSPPTVMRVIDELLDERLVKWSGDHQASGGRPSLLLEFNPSAYAVIGLDLGGTKIHGTLADLAGNVQEEFCQSWRSDDQDDLGYVDEVCALIEALMAVGPLPGQEIRGIGIGAPGVTYSEQGIVHWAPSLNWRDVPLRDILEERFCLPVIVENDVNLAALGEYGFGVARGASSLVCMTIGTGIGAGIVVDRRIHKGYSHSAGEVGYLLPSLRYLGRHYPGFGALEGEASGTGIEERARAYLRTNRLPIPADLDAALVFEEARAGAEWAEFIVSETVDYLALAIATIAALIDPEVIVLGGGVARSADVLIDPILERIEGVIPTVPQLLQSNLGSRAAVMGAILLVLDATTAHVTIKTPF